MSSPTTGTATNDRFSLSGRTAVVTGATEGIGRAIAEQFVAEDANVAICARTAEDVETTVRDLNDGAGGDAVGEACDVRDREAVERWSTRRSRRSAASTVSSTTPVRVSWPRSRTSPRTAGRASST
jgi:NAD(P)-dependent dehydrogenase (short-subunit alcohol dehydrogenase family)